MLPFLESNVLGMWNDAVFPSLSSPLSSSFAAGNADPWLLSSNTSPEIERLNRGNFFSTLQDACSDRSQLQSLISPPLGPNTGFITGQSSGGCYTKNTIPESNGAGDGGPVMATACSAARAQPKVSVAERRKRLIDRDPANKYQKTSPPSKRPKSTVPSQKQHRLPQDEATIAGTPLFKAPVRRSQKLGDKITSLQQLVSPFGKTDTASVLHEAALSIKFLHEQIRMLTAPYFAMVPSEKLVQGHAETRIDLQSTGLCLVPLSTMGGLMDGKAYDSRWPETMAMETDLNFY